MVGVSVTFFQPWSHGSSVCIHDFILLKWQFFLFGLFAIHMILNCLCGVFFNGTSNSSSWLCSLCHKAVLTANGWKWIGTKKLEVKECFGLNVASWFHQFYGRALRAPLPKQSDPACFCPSRPLTCKFPQQVVFLNVKEASKLIMIRLTDNLKPEQPADKNVVCLLNWVQIRYFHDLLGRHVWVRLHLIT